MLLAVCAITALGSLEQIDASRSIAHTHEVLSCIERVVNLVHETDQNRRHYGYKGDDKPYTESKLNLKKELGALRKITASNQKHQNRLNSLDEKVEKVILLSDKVAALSLQHSLVEARIMIHSSEYTESYQKILSLISQMRHEENEAWELHYKQYQERSDTLFQVLLFLVAGVVSVLTLLIFLTSSYIVEIRKAQSELSASENTIRSVIEQAYDAFIGIDTEGRITHWNPQAKEIFGWTSQNALGNNLVDLVIPETEREDIKNRLAEFRKSGKSDFINSRIEREAVHKDGRQIPVEISIFSAGADRSLRIYAFVHDISERRKAATELARSNADLQQFAYLASHDLQEPLRTVITFSDMLSSKASSKLNSEEKEYLKFIIDAVTRMRQLVKDLLSYSRIDSQGEEPTRIELNEVVKMALDNLHSAVTESGAEIKVSNLPCVLGDKTQLIQLFQNLIENALKFKDNKPPQIKISASPAGRMTRISVTDNGIGISMEYAEKIFELFQRLHPQSKYSGTGIGLSVCKRIVERHGGEMTVSSTPGKGATFNFTLPTAP